MKKRTLIIAEAGVNHNGDMRLAKELIQIAAYSGADIVKFQSFQAKHIVTPNATRANYQISNMNEDGSQYEMLRKLELDFESHQELISECKKHQIQFLSTAFDFPSIDLLSELNLSYWKIPSGEITNYPYLKRIGSFNNKVLLSTGMSDLKEIESALSVLESAGTQKKNISILHCTTEYPAPPEEVNLQAILTIKDIFGCEVGYSDHTEGVEISLAAVTLGATIIEKHFTIDKAMPGPDHKASLEPDELKRLVNGIRNIERAWGDGEKKPTASEIKNMIVARKSIVAQRNISSGEIFDEDNLTTKRPGNGISPMRWIEVIGKKAKKDFLQDDLIEL